MVELARYRREKALALFPACAEGLPLLLPIGAQQRHMSHGGVHAIVKNLFQGTACHLRLRGPGAESLATCVEAASAHWLRHMAGSHMANGNLDLRHVRDNLGHELITATSGYLHTSDDVRHREPEERPWIQW